MYVAIKLTRECWDIAHCVLNKSSFSYLFFLFDIWLMSKFASSEQPHHSASNDMQHV